MYCIEVGTCNIFGLFAPPAVIRRLLRLFGAPIVIRHPRNCATIAPVVTPLACHAVLS